MSPKLLTEMPARNLIRTEGVLFHLLKATGATHLS